jgi:DNA-directed RNA polymerase specialized sigma24 family protein
MREDLPRKRYSFHDVEQSPLSQDLEWMLQSNQVDSDAIIVAAARDHGALIQRLLHACLVEAGQVDRLVGKTLADIAQKRSTFKPGMSLRAWLASLALQNRQSRPLSFAPPAAPTPHEAELWRALDDSRDEYRLPAVLHYVFDFPESEIGAALSLDPHRLPQKLETISLWLTLCRPPEIPPGAPAEAWVKASLQTRWPMISMGENEIDDMVERGFGRLAHARQRERSRILAQQGGLVSAVLILLLVVTVLSNRALIGAPPLHVAPTRLVTRIVTIPVTATPTLPLPPLSATSSPQEILARLVEGCQCWQTARLQAVIHLYGPQNYIGLPLAYRTQAWLRPGATQDQASRFIITGLLEDNPTKALLTAGNSVFELNFRRETAQSTRPARSGLEDTQLIEMRLPIPLANDPINQAAFSYGLRAVLDGSYILQMLQPLSLVQPEVAIGEVFADTALGRPALAFDLYKDGTLTDRVWMDAHTGILLRRRIFDPSGLPVVQTEIVVAGFELGAPMPVEDLGYPSFFSKKLTWETFWQPAPGEDNAPLKPQIVAVGRRPFTTRQAAPEGSLTPDSLLFFQFLEYATTPERTPAADLYVNGYFLGYTEMANPWRTVCRRSPDGGKIAFAQAANGPDAFLNARAGLFWIDLAHPKITHLPWPAALDVGVDFVFSPDSRYLAIYACGGTESSCGIYIQDTSQQANTLLAPVQGLGIFLTWSPDGRFLAYVQTDPGQNWEAHFKVIETATGKIMYDGNFDWQNLSIPADSPAASWGVAFPPPRTGLDGCALPSS